MNIDPVAVVATCVSVFAAGVAVWQAVIANKSRLDANSSAKEAKENANRSVKAAEDAVNQQKAIAAGVTELAEKFIPNWAVSFKAGSKFNLKNLNGEDAHNVVVQTLSVRVPRTEKTLLPANSTLEIWGALGYGSKQNGESEISVTWNRPPEKNDPNTYSWEGSFPPKNSS